MQKTNTFDTALNAMITERFGSTDPAAWQEASDDIRKLFGHWEKRLPPELWEALGDSLGVAAQTGDCEPLVSAASIAQVELRRRAKEKLVQRHRGRPPKP